MAETEEKVRKEKVVFAGAERTMGIKCTFFIQSRDRSLRRLGALQPVAHLHGSWKELGFTISGNCKNVNLIVSCKSEMFFFFLC